MTHFLKLILGIYEGHLVYYHLDNLEGSGLGMETVSGSDREIKLSKDLKQI